MSTINVNAIDKESGSNLTLGGAGTQVTLHASATSSGFSEPAYGANASASTGAVNVDASDNLQFDSGYGSTATAYGCRAWVNFNGSGTVAIRDSGNVSSITDNGTGNFDVNFSTAMPDANYAISGVSGESGGMTNHRTVSVYNDALQTTYCEIKVGGATSTHYDDSIILIAVFR